MKKQFSARSLALGALMAALMCVLGPFSIPIGPIPVSLTPFVVSLAAMLLGGPLAAVSVVVYLLLGAVGLPVFSGFAGGLAKLVGPTGGYLVSFVLHALVGGLIAQKFQFKVLPSILGLALGLLLDYILGTAWFMLQVHSTLGHALKVCVLPFLPFDAVKIAGAVWLGRVLRRAIPKLN